MPEEWKDFVPSTYFSAVKCYCITTAFNIQGWTTDIVIGTEEGQIIEFTKKQVSRTFEIDASNCTDLGVFVTYDPYRSYYTVCASGNLYVLAREKAIKVHSTIKDVLKYKIRDFWKSGSPQLGVWYKDKPTSLDPHFITDLSSEESKVPLPPNTEFAKVINQKLKEAEMRISDLKAKLERRRELKKTLCQSFLERDLLPGSEASASREGGTKRPLLLPLALRRTWQRVHNRKWILGIEFCNKGSRSAQEIELILQDKKKIRFEYKSCIYMRQIPEKITSSVGEEWKIVESVPVNTNAFAVVCIDEPARWTDCEFSVCGFIAYKLEGDSESVFQLQFPDFCLTVQDFTRGLLSCFTDKEVSEENVLSTLTTSEHFELLAAKVPTCLDDIFTKNLDFSSLLESGNFFNQGRTCPSLGGIFVRIMRSSKDEYHISVYARDSSQALLLVQNLYSELPAGICISPVPAKTSFNLEKCYSALKSEISYVSEHLVDWKKRYDTGDGHVRIPKDEYARFRERLSDLEEATDLWS